MSGYSSLLLDETILLNVFARLPLKQVISCRNVCRSWRDLIDLNLNYQQLIVYTDAFPCHRYSWDHRPLSFFESLWMPYLTPFLVTILVNSILKNIRKLFIYCRTYGVADREFNLDHLNSFTELNELEVVEFRPEYGKTYKLHLNKLKLLKLSFIRDELRQPEDAPVELDTPRLRAIIGDFPSLVNHPETIRVLECDVSTNCVKLYELVNLEYLFFSKKISIKDDFLQKLQNLKVIQFFFLSSSGLRQCVR